MRHSKTNDVQRIAANLAKLPMVQSHLARDLAGSRHSVSRDD